MTSMLATHDRKRIEAAVASVEAKLDIDLKIVFVPASSRYRIFAVPHALFGGVLGGIIAIVAQPLLPGALIMAIELVIALVALISLQSLGFRIGLVPKKALTRAAWKQCRMVYADMKLKASADLPTMLFYCSVAERYAEILVDERVLARVPAPQWQKILDDFKPHMQRRDAPSALLHVIHAGRDVLEPHFSRSGS